MTFLNKFGMLVSHESNDAINQYITSTGSQIKFSYPSNNVCQAKPFKVTFNPGVYDISCYGGKGGGTNGGKGGKASGVLVLEKQKTLYLFIGAQGSTQKCMTFGGGGTGGSGTTNSGGGSTDIRIINSNESYGLRSRIIVAAGGGGGNAYTSSVASSNGGGINSSDSSYGRSSACQAIAALGATQTRGGVSPVMPSCACEQGVDGAFFYGGSSTAKSKYTSGGGGGYYGGASSNDGSGSVAGASGGSSFVSGLDGCNAIGRNGVHLNTSIHYSKIFFQNPSTESGINTGNGYITINRVAYLNINYCTYGKSRQFSYKLLVMILIMKS